MSWKYYLQCWQRNEQDPVFFFLRELESELCVRHIRHLEELRLAYFTTLVWNVHSTNSNTYGSTVAFDLVACIQCYFVLCLPWTLCPLNVFAFTVFLNDHSFNPRSSQMVIPTTCTYPTNSNFATLNLWRLGQPFISLSLEFIVNYSNRAVKSKIGLRKVLNSIYLFLPFQ